MFGLINCSTRRVAKVGKVVKTNAEPKPQAKTNFRQKKVSLDRFVGLTFRSNTGCWGCRKRRKKCDETHPACKACVKRNLPCVWRTDSNEPAGYDIDWKLDNEVPKEGTFEMGDRASLDLSQGVSRCENFTTPRSESFTTPRPESFTTLVEISNTQPYAVDLSSAVDTSPADVSPQVFASVSLPSLDFDSFSHLPSLHLSDVGMFLDSKGVSFVQHFDNNVSGTLMVSPTASNYFSKTFLLVASLDEGIGHAIASWGAYYAHGSLHHDVEHHLTQAVGLITSRFARGVAVSTHDYFILICFHLIVLGFFICQGDASQWWTCFQKCHELIERFGGLEKLCEEFSYSNDVKFLVSNFFYHDIMASHAFLHGPLVKLEEYSRIFRSGFFDSNYGIDPLQGCLNPVYMLLAEELEARTDMRTRKERLDSILNGELGTEDDPDVLGEFDAMRTQYLEFCAEIQSRIESKIANCHIDPSLLEKTDQLEVDLHLKMFALFKLVCKLYWVLFIKETSPTSNEVQLLLIKLMDGIEELVDTPMILVLCLPMLVAGGACYSKYDRRRLEKIFGRIMLKCPIKNVRKAWVVVQELWKKNPDGDKTLEWADVCKELGWELCVC